MTKKTVHVFRSELSQYLSPQFIEDEESSLRKWGAAEYSFGADKAREKAVTPNVWITSSNTPINTLWKKEKNHLLKDLKLIIHPNSGYDNFPLDFVKDFSHARQGQIVLGMELRAKAVAEYVLTGVLNYNNYSVKRNESSPLPKTAEWDKKRAFPRKLLAQKKILIIGHGHVGKRLENIFKAIGSTVDVYDPFLNSNPMPSLPSIDIVCVCASLNEKSRNMINRDFLFSLPDNFLLVNSARGDLVDLNALKSALSAKPNSFALIDVFPDEPYDFLNFEGVSNFHGTSHVAGVHDGLERDMIKFECKILSMYLDDQDLRPGYPLLKDRIQDNFLI